MPGQQAHPLLPRHILPGAPKEKQEQIIQACEQDPLFDLFQDLKTTDVRPQNFLSFYEAICQLATFAQMESQHLILFSGQHCKDIAEQFACDHPYYDTLHTLPGGVFLDQLSPQVADQELFFLPGFIVTFDLFNQS